MTLIAVKSGLKLKLYQTRPNTKPVKFWFFSYIGFLIYTVGKPDVERSDCGQGRLKPFTGPRAKLKKVTLNR